MSDASKSFIEKKEWIEFSHRYGQIDIQLCRFDRRGHLAIVYRDKPTHLQDSHMSWADEFSDDQPVSEEEIRKAFRELAGPITLARVKSGLSFRAKG